MWLVAHMARIEGRAMVIKRPQPAGELVGHADCGLVVALALLQLPAPRPVEDPVDGRRVAASVASAPWISSVRT